MSVTEMTPERMFCSAAIPSRGKNKETVNKATSTLTQGGAAHWTWKAPSKKDHLLLQRKELFCCVDHLQKKEDEGVLIFDWLLPWSSAPSSNRPRDLSPFQQVHIP